LACLFWSFIYSSGVELTRIGFAEAGPPRPLPSASWNRVSDYRGRSNLVLVFAGQAGIEFDFLQDAAARYQDFTEQDAVIVAVFPYNSQETHLLKIWATLPFVVLADDDGRVHGLYGAVDEHERPGPVIYVTDRFGEIVSVYDALGGQHQPSNDEVLRMLEFINHQCPECEPPEWPR
jgi:peroxiredoxin